MKKSKIQVVILNTLLYVNFTSRKIFNQLSYIIVINMKILFQHLVSVFYLAISSRVISKSKIKLYIKGNF